MTGTGPGEGDTMTTTTTTTDVRYDGHTLAVALGLVGRTPPPVHLPPLAQQIVPGRSPLEASGWADPVDGDRIARR